MILQWVTFLLPVVMFSQLVHAAGERRSRYFIGSAAFWLATSILIAFFFPSITFYNRGPQIAAGVYTLNYVGVVILAVISIYSCALLRVPRRYYVAPTGILVIWAANSHGWLA